MISRIYGRLLEKKKEGVIIDVHGICYEVLVPAAIMQNIDAAVDEDGMIQLVTYHYYQVDPSRSFPVLIGFLHEIEKDFFERFITVSGVGPKAAVRALSLPISAIAKAIYEGDEHTLRSLSGIGPQKAKEIIAKLQERIGKYGLLQESEERRPAVKEDVFEEAIAVLLQLEYTKSEASSMVKTALAKNAALRTAEDILNEVYKQRVGLRDAEKEVRK
ncbi:MAG: hypothetical protein JW844_02905 [Candidatus Omnitrophica bacterium]|nr:hypothetical protein [Candidatus Omnitrophota bacterium]